ncbi:MAG TPA: MauE/DoxX family redox-associated membrane protein [Mycobacteriales bacterium]
MSTATATTTPPPAEVRPTTRLRPWLGTAARLLLAVTWAWAAVAKMGDPAASLRAVRAYQVLPEWLAQGVGYGLPFLELGLAVLLLIGLATRAAAVVSSALLVVFLTGIVSAAVRGLQIECGCFGGGGQLGAGQSTAYTGEILRDAGLLLVSAFLVWAHRTRYAVDDAIRTAGPEPTIRGPRKTAEGRRRMAEAVERRRVAGERRVRLASAVTGIALVALVGAGIGIQAARIPAPTGPVPAGVSLADGVTVGPASAAVTLDLYEDPQCPVCAQFETQVGPQISTWVAAGTVKVHYHVISFLDSSSSTKYSSRAANALYAAAGVSPTAFARLHQTLFAQQPAEGSAGLTEDKLVQLAQQAGASSAEQQIRSGTYADYVARATDQSSKDGVTGTPTVKVDGKVVANPTLEAVTAAVTAAR